jgi:hypothetical protein
MNSTVGEGAVKLARECFGALAVASGNDKFNTAPFQQMTGDAAAGFAVAADYKDTWCSQ